ncbi:MAG TPA: NAD-dependent epimerase/dehydratase family protein [Anaerolineaceae bacterium]|nr:NAD-dependent epimerase/dehydratase family protein [Anaerolineaceae bacterium]
MKIFLTGGTGFIGKHMVRKLAQTDHQVRCLVRNVQRARHIQEAGMEIFIGDVTDYASVLAGMQGCDVVINLANLYSMWSLHREEFSKVNVEGTRNVMSAALETGVKKVVYVSTVAVYGKPDESPIREDTPHGKRWFSDYGRTKAEGDRLSWELHRTRGLPLVTLYPGIVLGAGDDKASGIYIQTLLHRNTPTTIFNHSKATYMYAGDVAEAALRTLEKQDNIGQKYMLGKEVLNGLQYGQMISEISGVPLPLFRFPDFIVMCAAYLLTALSALTRRMPPWGLSVDAAWTLLKGFVIDGSKAERELGIHYTPVRVALEEAIESYGVRKHGD